MSEPSHAGTILKSLDKVTRVLTGEREGRARALIRRIGRALSLLRHVGFPWVTPLAAGTPPAAALIRREGRAAMMRPFPRPFKPIATVLMTCLWPVQSWLDAKHIARCLAPDAFSGRDRGALARAAWRAALRHNVPPLEYFAYRLPDRPETAPDAWIYQPEMVRLLAALSRPEARRLADDKAAFANFCEMAGLSAVPVLGRIAPSAEPDEPEESRVIVKPRIGANGRHVTLWERDTSGWRSAGDAAGGARGWGALVDRLRNLSKGEELLVQPALVPHPVLAHLASGGAPAARIVTGLWPDGAAEVLSASFAAPPPGGVTSNGGPRRMVDVESGRLLPKGPGRLHDIFGDSPDCTALDDRALPDWSKTLEMVLAGHRAFPPRAVLLGWDVAFTPEGPVLIEVNMGLSFFLEQYESLVPAGTQPAAALIAAWLE